MKPFSWRQLLSGGVGLGMTVWVGAIAGIAQPPAPTSAPPTKTVPLFDRYMQAGYAATNRRDYSTALVFFKRALDERPDDTYATQAIRNVERYLSQADSATTAPQPQPTPASPAPTVVVPPMVGPAPQPAPTTSPKPAPAKPTGAPTAAPKPTPPKTAPATPPKTTGPAPLPTKPAPPTKLTPPRSLPTAQPTPPAAKPPTAVVVVPAAPASAAFSEQQAIALINRWLQAKPEVFAPPYDQQLVVNLTAGELLASLIRPNGVLDWLKANRAYFRYGVQKVDSVERFVVARDRATMEINFTEDRTLYLSGVVEPTLTDFSSQRVRFTFVDDNGTWKIADYKTVTGSLLERAILTTTGSAR